MRDADVKELATALRHPDCKFRGPLDLSENKELTDQSALYIADVLKKIDGTSNISKLNLSKTSMESKAGLFIGEALLSNPHYSIEKLTFKGVNIEDNGLYRLLEAANANKNIKNLHLGKISDYGLRAMADLLKQNNTLVKLEFSESKETS